MNTKNRFMSFLLFIALIGTTCFSQSRFYVTPSGAAETIFSENVKSAISRIVDRCMEMRWQVVSVSDNQAICKITEDKSQKGTLSLFTSAISGAIPFVDSSDTNPKFVRFSASTTTSGTSRVQADGWVVRDKTFGKATEEPIEASSFLDSMIVTMMDAGGKLPKGTSFTNHAFLDLAGESAKVEGTVGYLVNSVGAKGPAQSAGISSGDLITKIAGKRVTDFWSLTSALERASKKSSFEVEFVSRGQARMITVVTSFRSEVAEDPSLNREAAPKVADVTPITASSVADELLKLAKLKDQGLLSEREFENEKRKLLSK